MGCVLLAHVVAAAHDNGGRGCDAAPVGQFGEPAGDLPAGHATQIPRITELGVHAAELVLIDLRYPEQVCRCSILRCVMGLSTLTVCR